jgi:hypothetical protein
MSVQTGAITLVSWLMLFLFRSGRKAGSYLLASADDADDAGDADNAELAKTLLPTNYEYAIQNTSGQILDLTLPWSLAVNPGRKATMTMIFRGHDDDSRYFKYYQNKKAWLVVGTWCSFVIIHVIMIYKRWQPTRQQLLRGVTSLATLCIYRP